MKSHKILPFPQSRVRPKGNKKGFKELGLSKLAQQTNNHRQSNLIGHWCSRCKGIWYGYCSECECPKCGNRKG